MGINHLVTKYSESTPKEQNKIFILVRSIYLPKHNKIKTKFAKRWWDYLDSEYDYYCLQAILRFDPNKGVMFSTYLYSWAVTKPQSAVIEKYINKFNREPTFTDIGWVEDGLDDD